MSEAHTAEARKRMRNQVLLITYADSLGRNLEELSDIVARYCTGIVGGIHLLPFYPSSADRGFAPTTYDEVDPAFGSWEEIRTLADRFDVMVDFMINHLSRRSVCYRDFVQHKDHSPYRNMFIVYRDFWPGGEPTQEQHDLIYTRKPRAPFIEHVG